MIYEHFTEKLIGLQGIEIEKIEEIDNSIHLFCHLKRKPHKRPCCNKLTDKVHDLRKQVIKIFLLSANFLYPQLVKCDKTMLNWLSEFLNSFFSPITNGFTEGYNNKIKVLKRNAYGYCNFNRLRNCILHIFSHQELISLKKQATA